MFFGRTVIVSGFTGMVIRLTFLIVSQNGTDKRESPVSLHFVFMYMYIRLYLYLLIIATTVNIKHMFC